MCAPRVSRGTAKDPPVAVGDPRFEGWETVGTFEDRDAVE